MSATNIGFVTNPGRRLNPHIGGSTCTAQAHSARRHCTLSWTDAHANRTECKLHAALQPCMQTKMFQSAINTAVMFVCAARLMQGSTKKRTCPPVPATLSARCLSSWCTRFLQVAGAAYPLLCWLSLQYTSCAYSTLWDRSHTPRKLCKHDAHEKGV